jgi:hypothetical protein
MYEAVEERSCQRRRWIVKSGGAIRSENVGMSNVNANENFAHRIVQGFPSNVNHLGLVGPKARPKGVVDGQLVNIPVQPIFRPNKRI